MQPREPREPVPVALYVRSKPGDPDDSLEIQLRALQGHAGRNGMEQARVFFDSQDGRSQFERMMEEAIGDNPPFRRILVVELSRFAPESEELRVQLARLEGKGVTVEPIAESVGKTPRP